uniref:Uncharacterized protein LOC104220840 n=1 Tax=Nicotiana sylvestris TaxID=4096 RepID=A0A1U7VUR4_NICSY
YKFVFDEVCPEKPGDDATDDKHKAYQKWIKADEMARCYILASMSNVLQHQHQSMESAYDILENLKEMFGDQNRYPKGTKGGLFYCPKEKKVIVSTNAKFLEEDYLMNHVPRSKLVLQELSEGMETQSSENQNDHIQTPEVDFDIPLHFNSGRNVNRLNVRQQQVPAVILPQSSGSHVEQTIQQEEVVDIPVDSMETHVSDDVVVQPQNQSDVVATDVVHSRSGREIRQPVRYTLLGESYDQIPEEPTSEHVNYDQAQHDKDADKWVAAMKSEMESMYSNQV